MTPIANHAGEQLIVSAVIGTGVVSGSLLFLRMRISALARRRWPRRP